MDIYAELKQATNEQLLEAAVNYYKLHNPDAERWLRLGFALAQLDGWEQIAPAWLRDITDAAAAMGGGKKLCRG